MLIISNLAKTLNTEEKNQLKGSRKNNDNSFNE